MPCGKKGVFIEAGPATPSRTSAFYASALPQAGYKIKVNTLTSDPSTGKPQGMAEITFTGHGYTGLIAAIADLGAASGAAAHLPHSLSKNFLEISLTPPGTTKCPV